MTDKKSGMGEVRRVGAPGASHMLMRPAVGPAVMGVVVGAAEQASRDAVTAQVRAIAEELTGRARETGVTHKLDLQVPPSARKSRDLGVVLFVAALSVADAQINGTSTVAVALHNGVWGLYFTRALAARDGGQATTVPLVDAPFDVREKFLAQSGPFVTEFLERCEKVLAPRRAALAAGGDALARLRAAPRV